MIIITYYRKELDTRGRIRIISEEESVCPICNGNLKVIGVRKRTVINAAGEKEKLIIRRMRCKPCRKIHHELPDYVVPYKRHCAETIESIITDKTEDVCCDFVTEYRIKTWWATILMYFENVLSSLQIKYGAVFSTNSTPREIIRAITNTNLWVHTRTAMTPI